MLTGDLAVLQNLVYAVILIAIVIFRNAPALKGFREKYTLRALTGRIFKHRDSDSGDWDEIPTKIEMNEILSVDMVPQDKLDLTGKGGKR